MAVLLRNTHNLGKSAALLPSLTLSKYEVFLMGDMNIDLLDKNSEVGKKPLNFIQPYGLCQLIKDPTRYSAEKISLLDIFITNANYIAKNGTCDVNLKPIFHQKLGSRWLPNANETYTKNMKCTCPTPAPTPEGPTPPIFH